MKRAFFRLALLAILGLNLNAAWALTPEPCRINGPNRYLVSKAVKLTTNATFKDNPSHCTIADVFDIATNGKNSGNNKCGAIDLTAKPGILDVDAMGFTFSPVDELFLGAHTLRLKNFTFDSGTTATKRYIRVANDAARFAGLNGKFINGRDFNGGAILVEFGGDLDLQNVEFKSNRASSFGGAIAFLGYGTMTIRDSLFRSNSAEDAGGAISIGGSDNSFIYNTRIADNFAQMGGGGIRTNNSDLDIVGSYVTDNRAQSGPGGGVFSSGRIYVSCSAISDNETMAGDGGGIYQEAASGYLTVVASSIERNKAGSNADANGGGVFAGDDLKIVNSSISTNSTGGDGGGIYVADSAADDAIRIANNTLASNVATAHGGAMWITGQSALFTPDGPNDPPTPFGALHSFEILNNTVDGNGAADAQIWIDDAGVQSLGEIIFLNNILTDRKGVKNCAGLVGRLRPRRVNDPESNAIYNVQWPGMSCGTGISEAYGSAEQHYGWLFSQNYSETIIGLPGDSVACAAVDNLDQFVRKAPCRFGAVRAGPPPAVNDPAAPN